MSGLFDKYHKERIFDLFARNLELVKRHPHVFVRGKITKGYVCPVCQKIYSKDALFSKEYKDYLTLEHVPPGKLGGSVKLLTCKVCNNNQGSKLESHLIENLKTKDFHSGIPGVYREARFLVDGKWNTGGKIINTKHGGFEFQAIRKQSNHNHYKRLFEEEDQDIKKIDVTINHRYKKRRSEIALLRIGYLWLYSELGHSILINENIQTIRKQILEPKKVRIKTIVSFVGDLRDELEGVNIIKEPKSLLSFAVVFRTKTENKERKHLVLLPGPSDPGLKIYENLKNLADADGNTQLKLTKLRNGDILTDPDRVFDYYKAWNWLKD